MDKINNNILVLQYLNTNLDFFKSEYMVILQDLMIRVFDSEDESTLESEEEIKEIFCKLINSKEELITSLKEFINYIELLDYELQEYMALEDY